MGKTKKELAVIKVREILRLKEQGLSNRHGIDGVGVRESVQDTRRTTL